MTKLFFAQTNRYGSPTFAGFANTNSALAFTSRKERDEWVAANRETNMAVRALTMRDARPMLDRNGAATYAATIDGRFIKVTG